MSIAFEELWNTALPNPERGLIDGQALRTAMETLTLEQHEAVVMHEIEGLTYDEIGVILGVPAGTIKSRLHYAFITLRQRLLGCEEVAS